MDSSRINYSFGNWIKRRRKALDMTQQELARQIGCSVSAIVKIEADERRPSRQISELLAQHLEIPYEQRPLFYKIARREKMVEELELLPLPRHPLPQPIPVPAKSNLPRSLTPLIGREPELGAVIQQIKDPGCRLLTLTGLGGVGKTRLALEAAHQLTEGFVDGVYFVSLAGISSPEFILPAIADALKFAFSGSGNPRQQLVNYLREKRVLLVMDNFEHLLNGVDLLVEILEQAQNVKILATSREQLFLQAEWVFEVQGLPVPHSVQEVTQESNSAARLFLQRAHQARRDFDLSPDDHPTVMQICQLVEGLPLGIELVASWVRILSLAEIGREIEQGLGFIASSTRDLPERHRSIHSLLDHSWKLLSGEEQAVLMKLSVFRDGFSRRAAQEVAGATLPLLSALVAKSLVRHASPGRYDLHELVRQYAESRLQGEAEELAKTRDRHSHFFINFLAQRELTLKSSQQPAVLNELNVEIDNLRAAWDWASLHGEGRRLKRVSFTLLYFYEIRNWFEEGEGAFRRAAERLLGIIEKDLAVDLPLRIAYYDMLTNQAYFGYRLGRSEEAEVTFRQCIANLRASGDQESLRFALRYFGLVCNAMGLFEEGKNSLEECLELSRVLGQPWEVAITSVYIGLITYDQGLAQESLTSLESGLAIARRLGDARLLAYNLALLSQTLIALGEADKARPLLEESLSLSGAMGDRFGVGMALLYLGRVARFYGKTDEARSNLEKSVALFREISNPAHVAWTMVDLGYLELESGRLVEAKEIFTTAIQIASQGRGTMNALTALAGLAAVQARAGAPEQALEWARCVLQHPSTNWETHSRLESLLADLESQPNQPPKASPRARTLEEVLAELTGGLDDRRDEDPRDA